jgi:hypothetical protein
MPRYRRGDSDSKCPRFAEGDSFGASLRLIDILQDASRIVQKYFSRLA